jgi:uncharacterized protein YkwD
MAMTPGLSITRHKIVSRLFVLGVILAVGLGGFATEASAANVNGPVPVLDDQEQLMVSMINNYRVANGRQALKLSVSLTKSSAWMSKDLQSVNDLSHTDTLGRDPFVRMAAFGYTTPGHKGENIAGGYEDAATTFEQWRTSPHHNDNMLSSNYTSMGLARAYKSGAAYEWYWTNDFGGISDSPYTISNPITPPAPVETPIPVPQPTINGTVRSAYVAVSPQRLFDTRSEGAPLAAGAETSRKVLGTAGIPASGVAAVVLTVTMTQALADGFVTVYPTGTVVPNTSSLNVTAGATVANLVTIPVTETGKISLLTSGGGHFIADVAGYYAVVQTTSRSGRFIPVAPQRIVDTRSSVPVLPHGRRIIHMMGSGGLPVSGVSAVSLNVTITGSTNAGFVTAYPALVTLPNASNLNVTGPGQTVAAAVIVPVDSNGDVAIYVDGGGHLLVDINGWFTNETAPASTTGLFVPQTPSRTLDTRAYHAVHGGSDAAIGTPVGAVAASTNLTLTGTTSAGFLTAWPSDSSKPTVSSLNTAGPGATVANHAIVPTSTNGMRFATSETAHLLVDIDGWYLG